LIDAVARYDPAGLLLLSKEDDSSPSLAATQRLKQLLQTHLGSKRILNLSGGADKLVPYAAGEPFLNAFKKTIQESPELDVEFDDVIFDGVGHAFTPNMANKAVQWMGDFLAHTGEGGKDSKI
jgi:predicted esterase